MNTFYFMVFLFLFQSNSQAQKQETFSETKLLSLKKPIEAEMDPHKTDSYILPLKKGQFASIRITEANIRLYALVYDPSDSVMQIVDENQMGNKEVISLNATMTGNYTIKVMWDFMKPLTGKYTITLDKLEETGKTPALRAEQMFDGWYENDAPGAAVVVVQNNQVVFKRTKGIANMEEHIPIKNNSVFEMASCSKQFTGFAIAILVDRKMISMDDDIRKYLPEIPDYGSVITIANLVYHTSGIRSTDVLEMAGFSWEDILTLPMIVKFAANQKHLKFKPGEKFNYSNTNYNLLAEIAARVTKQSYSSWTKENIFMPLGMTSTFFKEDPGYVYAHKVLCYKPGKEGFVQRQNNFAATGSAGLCTSIDDLVKWVNSFDTRQLITKNMEVLLATTGTLNDGSKTQYAFGNFIGPQGVEHLGLVIGYRTAIMRFHDPRLSVVYLSNDDNDATYQRYYKIKNMFLDQPEKKPGLPGLPKVDEVLAKLEKKEIESSTVDLSEYTGVFFSSELNSSLPLTIKDKKLVIAHPRMNDIVLSQTKDDNFGFIKFARNTSNKVISLTVLGENIEFKKAEN